MTFSLHWIEGAPLQRAAGEAGGGRNIDADGGLMLSSAEIVRKQSSLTGVTQ